MGGAVFSPSPLVAVLLWVVLLCAAFASCVVLVSPASFLVLLAFSLPLVGGAVSPSPPFCVVQFVCLSIVGGVACPLPPLLWCRLLAVLLPFSTKTELNTANTTQDEAKVNLLIVYFFDKLLLHFGSCFSSIALLFPFHISVGLSTFGKVKRRNSDLNRHSVWLAASAKQTLKVSLSSPPPSTPDHTTHTHTPLLPPPTHTLHSSTTTTPSSLLPDTHHRLLLPRPLLFGGFFLADLAGQGGIRISKLNSLLTSSKVIYNFGTYPCRFWQHAWSPSSRLETRTNMCVICVRFSLCLSYVTCLVVFVLHLCLCLFLCPSLSVFRNFPHGTWRWTAWSGTANAEESGMCCSRLTLNLWWVRSSGHFGESLGQVTLRRPFFGELYWRWGMNLTLGWGAQAPVHQKP